MKRINLTQDDLHRLISLQRQLMRDTEQLHMLFDLAQGTASVPTDTLRVQNSLPPSGNKFAVAAADLSEVMEQEEAELEELQKKVKAFISTIEEPVESRIIYMRYISCYDWDMIASLLNYTSRHVFRIHNRIVQQLPVSKNVS